MRPPDMDAQLSLDYRAPHHLTSLEYPSLDLLVENSEHPYFLPPLYDDRMYLPTDLIPNARVAANTSRSNESESSFFTFERANAGNSNPTPALMSDNRPAVMRLIHDTRVFQHTIGKTQIFFVTFAAASGDHTRFYDFLVTDLFKAARTPNAPMFVSSMVMLVERQNMRAITHVSLQLELQGFDDDLHQYGFKPARQIEYAPLLRALLKPVKVQDLDVDDQACSICRDPYETTTHGHYESPVTLPCGHIIGEICVSKWYNGNGEMRFPADLSRPLCRQCPFSTNILKALEFGLTNGVYLEDARYTAYENFERSCADLDDAAYDNDDQTEFTPRPAVTKQAMHFLLEGAKLEEESSTPYCLQPARFPETQKSMRRVDLISPDDPGAVAVNVFVNISTGLLLVRLLKDITTPETVPFLGPPDGLMSQSVMRPGLGPFLHRLLSRAARFQRKRPCNCSAGFHKHSLRTYYNAREEYE
ncbi:hypothetical protein LTR85_003566 [Meristemomyces frigidus]|nr:hypothetical protein LTR85_003566 [Meristemomyces frigidus]